MSDEQVTIGVDLAEPGSNDRNSIVVMRCEGGAMVVVREIDAPGGDMGSLIARVRDELTPEQAKAVEEAIGGRRRGDAGDFLIADNRRRSAEVAALTLAAFGSAMPRVGGGFQRRGPGPASHRRFPVPR